MSTTRSDDAAQRYRAILETAARIICAKGYEGTSMQEIADACKLTKAGLYHHIKNKEHLLVEIMSYGMDVFEEHVLANVRHIADPVERLKRCMDLNVKLVTQRWSKEITIILHENAALAGEDAQRINARKKEYVRFLESAIAEAISRGQFRPVNPTVAAFSFLGMVLWTYKWFRVDGALSDDQIAQGMIDVFFNGLLAQRHSTPRLKEIK
jgi:AcrR family transcriptional regulator